MIIIERCSIRCSNLGGGVPIRNASEVRERILTAAMALIHEGNGDVAALTTRAIAQRAGVGVGLINYHFQSKENLITQGVQRMIANVVASFAPADRPTDSPAERLTDWAAQVFEFLFANPSLSRISILADFSQPSETSNSVRTQLGLTHALPANWPAGQKALLTFVLTTAMQAAFLGGECNASRLGYAFDTPENRRAYIARLVRLLMGGVSGAETKGV